MKLRADCRAHTTSIFLLGLFLTAISLVGCGGGGGGKTTTAAANKVTITGTVAIPESPPKLVVLSSTQHMAFLWQSCPSVGNDTGFSGSTFLLESTNNCGGAAQFVHFLQDTPKDMTAYSTGSIIFKIQVNNTNQQFTFLIQDNNTITSNVVNILNYGYDSTKVAVDQTITIPVSDLLVAGFDLTKVKRFFQINVQCSAVNCLTTLSDIKWQAGAAVLAKGQNPAVQKTRTCVTSFLGCRRLSNAPVRIVRPSATGWKAEPAVDSVTTDSNGNFTITVDLDILIGDGPIFIGVSDSVGTFTLLSAIPDDLIIGGAIIDLAVDRTTTAAAIMVCSNGLTIPADGSGGYCIGDPISSSDLETLYATVDLSFTTTTSVDLDVFLPDVFDDPSVLDALNKLLSAHSLPQVTAQQITTTSTGAAIPIISTFTTTPPVPGGSASSYDGTYSGSFTTVSPLGTTTGPGTVTVTNGHLTDPDGFFTGEVDSSGNFTGSWNYCQGCLPIPMSGVFSTSSSFTLSGSVGSTVSGTATLRKV